MNRSSQLEDRQLLELLLEEEGVERSVTAEIVRDDSTPPPLSRAQRRLWFLQQSAPNSPAYNVLSAVQLSGELDVGAFEQSLNEIVRRHEVLRSCFPSEADRPEIRVLPDLPLRPAIVDLRGMATGEQEEEIRRQISAESSEPFDLECGPLLRVRLLQLDEHRHVVILAMHHIVTDAWSMGVFITEFSKLYSDFSAGKPSSLDELEIQYGDFARWQQKWLEGPESATQLAWWKEHLEGLTPLEISTDRARPAEPTYRGAIHPFTLSPQVSDAVKSLARQEDATLFMTLLAAFSVLLHRYCQQDDIVVGTPIANRNRRELDPLIGFFVNSLVMRCDLSGQPGFRTLLRRVRDFALEAYAHQDLPFDVLVNEIAPDRGATHNPLFQVMFAVENAPAGRLDLPELTIAPQVNDSKIAKFDLLLNVSDTPDGLIGAFEYSVDLFDDDTIARMGDQFELLLSSIVADPDRSVAKLALLREAQKRQLLVEWNETRTDYPRGESIHALFERHAKQFPAAIALEFGSQQISYHQLNERANQLARLLQARGIGLDSSVAVHMKRSADMMVGLLAILKAGGFYVPLDPDYPPQRLAMMLDDCRASVLLTETDLTGNLPQRDLEVICLDAASDMLAGQSGDNLDSPRVDAEQLAYVIYTSGSTGIPKGVAVPHRAVVRLVRDTNYIQLESDDRVAQASNASFDAATFEIWGALLNGAQLVGVSRETMLAPVDFAEFLQQQRITTLFLTTALFNQMAREVPAAFGHMRNILFGGELVDAQWVRAVLDSGPPERLLHVYGPTENTTFSTWYEVSEVPPEAMTVPIGRAISNTELYVLDHHRQVVPIGVFGELYLGGEGLARGYLDRSELTDDWFVENPFDDGRSKLYRTGDLVRWLPGGDLEFRGRRDSQIKIRGFRIELGEIESALLRQPQVRQTVVLACEDQPGHRELVAYVAGEFLAITQLRESLSAELPDYMVPAKYVLLDELPLNENGKIDRRALPPPDAAQLAPVGEFAPPRNELEECLANIWKGVLHCERVGIHDNYFELGGDSITAIQLVSRLKRAGWQVKVAELFQHPTIARLAPRLEPDLETTDVVEEIGEIPLTAVQRWFFEHYQVQRHHFNQAVLLRAHERLDEERLRHALTTLQGRHDALRLTFEGVDDVMPTQIGRPAMDQVALEVIDLRNEGEDVAAALEHHAGAVQGGIDLRQGPLLRAALFRSPDGDRLLLVIHHLAVDGVSWRILLEDLQLAYQDLDPGATTSSFRGWADYVQRFAESDELRAELDYWSAVEQAEVAPLPIENASPTNRHGDAQTVHEQLSQDETSWLLTQAHRAHQTEIMDLLMTALGRALKGWTGSDRTLITLEGHGREHADDSLDLNRTVGWFTSIYPFLLSVPDGDTGSQILRVKEDLRRIPNKGAGYGILRYVAGQPLTSNPQISFNYLGKFDHAGADSGLFEFSDESSGKTIAGDLDRVHELDFVGVIGQGRLILSLEFNPQRLSTGSVVELLADFRQQLQSLIEHSRRLIEPHSSTSRQDVMAEADRPGPSLPPEISADNSMEIAAQIVGGEIEDIYPLSPMQEGLLFETLYEPDDTAYIVQSTFRIEGPLRPDLFQQSWNLLSQRHAVLRSALIHEEFQRPLQVVLKERPPEFHFFDLRGLPADEADRRIEQFRQEQRKRGFDFQREVLIRFGVFCREDNVHELVWAYHHVVLDGWCTSILYPELSQAYSALCRGQEPEWPGVVPFRNYIDWLGQRDLGEARAFWAAYAAEYHGTATLPKWQSESTRTEIQKERLVFDTEQTGKLKTLAASCGVTMNTVVQCLWGLLLCRYNDCDDVIYGAIVSGRPTELEGVEHMVGVFINAVPVRIRCEADQSFVELLQSAQQSALASQPYSYVPLVEIQSAAGSGGELFDHLLVCENYPRAFGDPDGGSDEADLRFELIDVCDYTHYDFSVTVDVGQSLVFQFEYRPSVFPTALIKRLSEHVASAVQRIIETPRMPAASVVFVPESDLGDANYQQVPAAMEDELLELGTGPREAYESECTIAELFQRQVAESGSRIAAAHNGRRISYHDLNARANQIAHRLGRMDVARGDIVGILDDRGIDFLSAMLGVLKAGAAFLPLDPAYPPDRVRFMLENSEARTLITRSSSKFMEQDSGPVAWLDLDADELSTEETKDPPARGCAADLAYVLYTSGSTGLPKGAMVRHNGAVNHIFAEFDLLNFHRDTRFLQTAPASSDISVWQFLAPVLIGGRTVVADYETVCDAAQLFHTIKSAGITLIEVVPAVMIELLEYVRDVPDSERGLPALEWAMITGEAAPVAVVNQWLEAFPAIPLANAYGPTEAADDICQHVVDLALPPNCRSVPIGRPLANLTLYVLDEELRLVPRGAAGEICVSGVGVGAGYVNDEVRTRENFVQNPFADRGLGEVLYRTGDLGRWIDDGTLEYLDRIDHQVKVRGYRIELGEIEAALSAHAQVRQAVALARGDGPSQKQLVAFVVPAPGESGQSEVLGAAELRDHLRHRLPEHMIPTVFEFLDALPLTPSGKIDRAGLPDIDLAVGRPATPFVAPRNQLEERLAGIWQQVLQIDEIGVHDDFFQLGGHSLKAMQVVAQVRKQLEVNLSLRQFFETPTVGQVAAAITAAEPSQYASIAPCPTQEYYDLSHAQQRIWLQHHLEEESTFSMPTAFVFDQVPDIDALNKAFASLIARHEALRTAFVLVDGEPKQKVLREIDFHVDQVDLRENDQRETLAHEYVDELIYTPFDLTRPPLLQAALIRLADRRFVFALNVHHIIGDGWSETILFRETLELYEAYRNDRPNPLRPLRIQYKDYAAWQNSLGFQQEEQYWLQQLANVPNGIHLPRDSPPDDKRDVRDNVEELVLPAHLTAALRNFAAARRTTVSIVGLALFKLLLFRWTRQEDICVGMSVANRNHPDTEALIGFFVNILPLRSRVSADMEFDDLLQQVKRNCYEAFENQDYPFDLLVRKLNQTRTHEGKSIVNVAYAYQNFLGIAPITDGPSGPRVTSPNHDAESGAWTPFAHSFPPSKFDLNLIVTDEDEEIQMFMQYDCELFHAATIKRLLRTLAQFVDVITEPREVPQ